MNNQDLINYLISVQAHANQTSVMCANAIKMLRKEEEEKAGVSTPAPKKGIDPAVLARARANRMKTILKNQKVQ